MNDEDKFNVTDRIISLFPRIDDDPSDGFISLHELTQWNMHLALRDLFHRAQRELELHDKDRDGFVSFSEYQPPTWTNIAGLFFLLSFLKIMANTIIIIIIHIYIYMCVCVCVMLIVSINIGPKS